MVTVLEVPLPPKTILLTGTSVVLLEYAESVRLPIGVSISPMVKGILVTAVSSLVVLSVISEIVGGSLIGLTVRTKVSDAVKEPSLTVTVIVLEPY